MILRIDIANACSSISEFGVRGAGAARGKFGEMSTLMNYTFQSFNFRGRDKMKPFYDLIANMAAEEYGHMSW